MKNLTIRHVSDAVAEALEEERRGGESLKLTVLELLSQGLRVGTTHSNGLGRLAGSWTEEEFREFEEAVVGFECLDDRLWR